LFYAPGAALGTSSAGGTPPYILSVDFSKTEGRLADDLSNTKLPYPVPGANRIAQATLKAKPEGFAAGLFYFIDNLFKGSDCFHCFYQSSSLTSPSSKSGQKRL
jgi:hypothetical protein